MKKSSASFLSCLLLLAVLLALTVIALGTFTRLADAGLGCPDWPGCYGRAIPVASSAATFPDTPWVAQKAWAEMIHRYAVGLLGLLSTAILFTVFCRKSRRTRGSLLLCLALILLLVFQILLGKFTVTLKLWPIIVTLHLLGGFLIAATLWLLYLHVCWPVHQLSAAQPVSLKIFAVITLLLLLGQIFLGAWTSTHYASLSCADFPFCMNEKPFVWHVREAFHLHAAGVNYEGGVLPVPVRQTIQMLHRCMALAVSLFLLGLVGLLLQRHWRSVYLIAFLLPLQLCLGIINVLFHLPVAVAVGHTLTAALLLLALVTVQRRLW